MCLADGGVPLKKTLYYTVLNELIMNFESGRAWRQSSHLLQYYSAFSETEKYHEKFIMLRVDNLRLRFKT
jgi:hypothetical protein